MSNPYLLDVTAYERDLKQYTAYCQDAALYLSKCTQDPYDVCHAYVLKETGKGGKFEYKDPMVNYLIKESDGNRVHRQTTLSRYFKMVTDMRLIMAPTLTAYYHPDDKQSILAEYIQGELNNRSANKKMMLKARAAGDKVQDSIYNNRQQRNKIKCNSLSGAHGTPSSVLFNQSAHSTLTSTCRSASSNTNANTERYLMGNRHYWSFDTVINNFSSIINNIDMDAVKEAVNYYRLAIPTTEDVVAMANKCSRRYWDFEAKRSVIERFVNGMDVYEKCAIYYNADMYHLAKLNPDVVRDLLWHISTVATDPVESPKDVIETLNGDEVALVSIVCAKQLNFSKLFDKDVMEGPHYGIIGGTAQQVKRGIAKYAKLISALWVTSSIPASMAYFPNSIREAVIASDTDSSIFTSQFWTQWYIGKLDFTPDSISVAAAVTFLCSQLTQHVLATMSGNMGVAKQHMRTLEMKNEFAFPVFSLTTMAKHYFAMMAAQEGNVYEIPHWEIKGATLRNSKAPVKLMERADNMIKEIAKTLMAGEMIELIPYVREIAEKELSIYQGLRDGDTSYYATGQIKLAEGYKQGTKAPMFQNYSLWNEVFGPKYGTVLPPPYNVIKVSLECDSVGKMKIWLDEMQDKELAARMRKWMMANEKRYLTTLWIPMAEVRSRGVPIELLKMMDVKKMVITIMRTYYLILECLGYYTLNKKLTRLVSDDLVAELEYLGLMDSKAA